MCRSTPESLLEGTHSTPIFLCIPMVFEMPQYILPFSSKDDRHAGASTTTVDHNAQAKEALVALKLAPSTLSPKPFSILRAMHDTST